MAKTSEAQKRATAKYDRENSINMCIKLSRKYDADIIEALNNSGNKQGYIKELIRADLAKKTPSV